MISCAEAVRQLWEYLDATVDPARRAEIDDHLSLCARCCGELEFAVEMRRLLADSGGPELPEDVRGRLNRKLKELE
ncbi:zf-HC2 domain-containing protein [Streptomyces alkaliterrae]|uniref:Zf-HC2 domain-containing protein n=1 Tax=Streptomyces alkaliterrae TaxID=2213162 RepID=A0A5P0YRQ6_9ACTN|nr:zf-HC2 domain-containing protein [Streptomyces alkaliterrae]MBB1251804.1 zf-HC2 domain-containing protein [Streptomyces alkaliterrae]MBB1257816.1 zf-HC2 domain-containing protein [Streptomyces alkaliterrae]MQS01189.1 zf-HC2 domain-containing protein [Streptomyces alkaliterrae]